MVANVDASGTLGSPNCNYAIAYVSGDKAAQNDTITVTDFEVIYYAQGVIEPASGDTAVETVTVDDTTKNMLNLTGGTAGTFHGIIAGMPK